MTPEERAKAVQERISQRAFGDREIDDKLVVDIANEEIAAAIREAVKEEREACAKLVETFVDWPKASERIIARMRGHEDEYTEPLSAAIRARSKA